MLRSIRNIVQKLNKHQKNIHSFTNTNIDFDYIFQQNKKTLGLPYKIKEFDAHKSFSQLLQDNGYSSIITDNDPLIDIICFNDKKGKYAIRLLLDLDGNNNYQTTNKTHLSTFIYISNKTGFVPILASYRICDNYYYAYDLIKSNEVKLI